MQIVLSMALKPEKNYTGKELPTWQYWMDDKTGRKVPWFLLS